MHEESSKQDLRKLDTPKRLSETTELYEVRWRGFPYGIMRNYDEIRG